MADALSISYPSPPPSPSAVPSKPRRRTKLGRPKSVVDVQPRIGRGGDQQGRLRYRLKGTDKATARRFSLIGPNGRWKARQGVVPYKRSGTSNNIGRTARERYEQDRSHSECGLPNAGVGASSPV